jgi:hypothetical protein
VNRDGRSTSRSSSFLIKSFLIKENTRLVRIRIKAGRYIRLERGKKADDAHQMPQSLDPMICMTMRLPSALH